jgi:hypothetical protein
MSIISKLLFILVLTFNLSFSQEKPLCNNFNILVGYKDPLLAYYSVEKDTSGASISIYINGYESKEKRKKIIAKYKNKANIKRDVYINLPTFSINFLSVKNPEKLFLTIRNTEI